MSSGVAKRVLAECEPCHSLRGLHGALTPDSFSSSLGIASLLPTSLSEPCGSSTKGSVRNRWFMFPVLFFIQSEDPGHITIQYKLTMTGCGVRV